MERIHGTVQKVYFAAPNDTFCAFLIIDNNKEKISVAAKCQAPFAGDELELEGTYEVHQKYGKQFVARSFKKQMPHSVDGIINFFNRMQIKGLGPKTIERIMAHFGSDLPSILRDDPKQLMDVPNVRKSITAALYDAIVGAGELEQLYTYLATHGLSTRWGKELYNLYGSQVIGVLEDNPYVMLSSCQGISFSMVDRFAQEIGFAADSPIRIEAGVSTVLSTMNDRGHTCMPMDELIENIFTLLDGFSDAIVDVLENYINDGIVYYCEYEGVQYIYPLNLYYAEASSADLTLHYLSQETAQGLSDMESFFSRFEEKANIILGPEQKKAIETAVKHKISIITGGPGTGKTTIVKALVSAFQQAADARIILCAPTGRAAKRLGEATSLEATTIHRLLIPSMNGDPYDFLKNEDDLLEADVIIVDEASMLNIQLYGALLAASPKEATIILVGDADQLPPIGAGFVLKDLLSSESIPRVKLHEIYRQKSGNYIVSNAHLINGGSMPLLHGEGEFVFIPVDNISSLMNHICLEYERAKGLEKDPLDVQIICPMRRGPAGSVAITKGLKQFLSNGHTNKAKVTINGEVFRIGDKIIQNVNNYDLDIFNGEIGMIFALSEDSISIRFPHREVRIQTADAVGFSGAEAITVHKSQGSEYGTVIIPFISAYGIMLQRNLLYTAITRAKHRVIVIGTERAIKKAISVVDNEMGHTLFKERILGLIKES